MIDHVTQEAVEEKHARRSFGFFDIENSAHLTLNAILTDIIADGVDRNVAIQSVYKAVNKNCNGHATAWSRFERLVDLHGLEEAEQLIRDTLMGMAGAKKH